MTAEAWLPGVDEARDPALSQFFTPPGLARQMAELADLPVSYTGWIVEPSAGDGAIVRALLERFPQARVLAIDIDPRMCAKLRQLGERVHVLERDFLGVTAQDIEAITTGRPLAPLPMVGALVMNPPYEGGQDREHVLHALSLGPVVALTQDGFPYCGDRWRGLWAPQAARLTDIVFWINRANFGEGTGPKRNYATWCFSNGDATALAPGETVRVDVQWRFTR